MKKICQNCQYCRGKYWCSNSKSPYFRFSGASQVYLFPDDTCDQFTRRWKKAPWWMRLFNKIMRGRQQ